MQQKNYFTYKRISTKEERGLQKYARQEKALKKYAEENKIDYVAEFEEDISGSTDFSNREKWSKLEKLLHTGDTIIFKDIYRFTRDAESGYKKYMELLEKGIELIFLDNSTVNTDYIKSLLNIAEQQNLITKTLMESIVKIMIIAELDKGETELKNLRKRIKDGMAASDKKAGRKAGALAKMSADLETDIKKLLQDRSIKYVDLMTKYNLSRNTLKKYIAIVQEQEN